MGSFSCPGIAAGRGSVRILTGRVFQDFMGRVTARGLSPPQKKRKISMILQSPLVIVDSSVCRDSSSNSTITEIIHAKIDNRSAQSVHYNGKFHYYERRLYFPFKNVVNFLFLSKK